MIPNVLRIAFAIVVLLWSSLAPAQSPPPSTAADAPAAAPDTPRKPLTRKEARALKASADARLCLEFPTQQMIIMCAEKYRPDKVASQVSN